MWCTAALAPHRSCLRPCHALTRCTRSPHSGPDLLMPSLRGSMAATATPTFHLGLPYPAAAAASLAAASPDHSLPVATHRCTRPTPAGPTRCASVSQCQLISFCPAFTHRTVWSGVTATLRTWVETSVCCDSGGENDLCAGGTILLVGEPDDQLCWGFRRAWGLSGAVGLLEVEGGSQGRRWGGG